MPKVCKQQKLGRLFKGQVIGITWQVSWRESCRQHVDSQLGNAALVDVQKENTDQPFGLLAVAAWG